MAMTNANKAEDAMVRDRLIPYLIKSTTLIAVLFALSKALPTMPAWAVALALAALSLVPATGSIYRLVVTRTFKQRQFGEGSMHKGRYLLRIPIFVGLYALSAVSVASMFMESPTWGVGMWATVVLAVPLYIGVSAAAGWFVNRKEKAIPLVRDARATRFSVFATGVFLCLVYTVISCQFMADYGCAADAFMAAPKPFEGSPSALMREAGDLTALVNGLSSYALVKLSETSWHVYLALQVALNAASILGIAAMLSVCLIEPRELKRAFLVLEGDSAGDGRPFVKAFCAVFALLPLLLIAGVVVLDARAQDDVRSQEYTFAKKVVQDQVSLIVYEFDGKYYNPEMVNELLAHAGAESEALTHEAEEALVPLINASFDARMANVDSYLDWYYGLFTDWEMLANMVAGNAEDFAKEQLETRLEQGIDDTELNSKTELYLKRAEDLQSATIEAMSKYELTQDYPDWLVKEKDALDMAFEISLEPSQKFLKANERMGISLAAGAISGIIAKKIIGKIAAKSAFKAMASRVGGLAAASAASSSGGPLVFAAVVIASFGMDIAMVKADELMNRDAYREELISAIEEQRQEALATVQGNTAAGESL